MANITGVINIEFDTDKPITEEQFKKFKKAINSKMNDWEMDVYDTASELGFEADSIGPMVLDELQCDFDTDEDE